MLKAAYKELQEFIDCVSFLITIWEKFPRTRKEYILRAIKEAIDVYKAAKPVYKVLNEIAWGGSGYNALVAFIRYKLLHLSGISKIIEKPVAKWIASKVRQWMRKFVPKPKVKPGKEHDALVWDCGRDQEPRHGKEKEKQGHNSFQGKEKPVPHHEADADIDPGDAGQQNGHQRQPDPCRKTGNSGCREEGEGRPGTRGFYPPRHGRIISKLRVSRSGRDRGGRSL